MLILLIAALAPQDFASPSTFDHRTNGGVDLADLDGNGFADLIVSTASVDPSTATWTLGFRWARNDGAGLGALELGATSTVSEPFSLRGAAEAADLDGDGILDVITTLGTSFNGTPFAGVEWFRGSGAGRFEPGRRIYTGGHVQASSFTSDLDGDGDLDVVVIDLLDQLFWVENLGGSPASFGAPVPLTPPGTDVRRTRAVDLDSDGDADLAMMMTGDGILNVAINGGAAGFGPLTPQPVPNAYWFSLASGDVDGDGDVDLLSTLPAGNQVVWYENDGTGSFAAQNSLGPAVSRPSSVRADDIDGDGVLDVHHGSSTVNSSTGWYRGLGGGTFAPAEILVEGVQAATDGQLGAADLDGDGALEPWAEGFVDVPLDSVGRGVRSVDTEGSPAGWTTSTVGTPYRLFTSSAPLDADGDGDLDLAVTSISGVSIQFNGPEGRLQERRIVLPGADSNASPVPADVDGDGDTDLIIALGQFAGPSGVHVSLNDGSGGFGPLSLVGSALAGFIDPDLRVADLEGDGDIDILVPDFLSVDRAHWLINDGSGSFGMGPAITPEVRLDCLVADVDGDGLPEIVQVEVAPGGSGVCQLALYQVLPTGQHDAGAPLVQFSVPCGATGALAAGELDGDGLIDLVYLDQDTGAVSVLPSLGGGTFGPAVPLLIPQGIHRTTLIVDVDLDGRSDLVIGSEDASIWMRNLGSSVFGTPRPLALGAPRLTGFSQVADLDGDGDMDILERSELLLCNARIGSRACVADVPNSTGEPGRLVAAGSVEVAANDLQLLGTQLPPGEFAMFITGSQLDAVPQPGGSQGTLCLGGSIGRFNRPLEIRPIDPSGSVRLSVDLGNVPSGPGPVALAPGDARLFQLWHRDSGSGAPANFTSALEIRFE